MSKEIEQQENKMGLVNVDEINRIDDANIIDMMTGKAMHDYVYSFKQGSKVVEGLTLAGINEAANRRGGIQVEDIEYKELEKSWICTAKAVDTIDKNSRYGAYEQPKMAGNRQDPFAFTKAIHKAQRNAIKQLIPTAIIREVLNHYLNKGQKPNSEPASEPNFQRECFVLADNLQSKFDAKSITKQNFWDYVKNQFSVESRKDMLPSQWTTLSAELRAAKAEISLFEALCNRIEKFINSVNEEPAEEVPTIDEAKANLSEIWALEEDAINPLSKRACFKAGVETYGDSNAWDALMWKQFAHDIVNFRTNYLGELREQIIQEQKKQETEESEQEILDSLESDDENK